MSDVPGVSPSTLKRDLKDRLTAPIQYYRPLMLTGNGVLPPFGQYLCIA